MYKRQVGARSSAAPLATLGVTSLHAVSLAAKLSDAAALDLAPTLVFEHVSIDGVAAHILSYFADDEAPAEHPARRPSLVSSAPPAAALAIAGSGARLPGAGQDKRAKFPTSKAPISAVFHSFRLIFGRAIISRNDLEAWMLFSGTRARGTLMLKRT